MRLILLPILVTIFMVFAAVADAQGITLSLKRASLETIFREVENQTGHHFIYTQEEIRSARPVSISVTHATLEKVMDHCLKGQSLTYTFEDGLVVIHSSRQQRDEQPTYTVRGRVVDTLGNPLNEVTIRVRGSSHFAISNANGFFLLAQIRMNDVLEISRIEMETVDLTFHGSDFPSIQLSQKIGSLDETIVTSYSSTTRRFNTGNITRITARDIAMQPVGNPLAALEGHVPGLWVSSTSGLPGAPFIVQVRGQNSLNPNPGSLKTPPKDNPLFVIDGVCLATQNVNINQLQSVSSPGMNPVYANPYGGMSPFNSLSPADIESIEVLKDADATAIYGSRGANGVILITTKKGVAGKARFDLDINSGVGMAGRLPDMMNTGQYLQMRREALANDNIAPSLVTNTPGYAPDLLLFDSSAYTNWTQVFLGGHSHITDLHTAVSGGNANTQFFAGAGYRHEGYILPGDLADQRSSLQISLQHHSRNNRLQTDFAANGSYDRNHSSGKINLLQSFTLPPNYPSLADANGNLLWYYKGINFNNPLSYLKQTYRMQAYDLITHFQLKYQLRKGWIFNSSFGYNDFNGKETRLFPKSSQNPGLSPTATADYARSHFSSWIIEPKTEFTIQSHRHVIDILVGFSWQRTFNARSQINAFGFSSDDSLFSAAFANSTDLSAYSAHYDYIAVFSRLNYRLNNRYIIDLNLRRDGSSRLGASKQFGNFASAAAGWLLSETALFKEHLSVISYGKIRASYGITGNDNIGNYKYLPAWISSNGQLNLYQGTSSISQPTGASAADLDWSVTRKLELALELGLWKDRLLCNLSWYRHRTSRQLLTYSPDQSNGNANTTNFPAIVQNSGIELELTISSILRKNFEWNNSLVLTIPKNKLIRFPGISNSTYASLYTIGQSVSVLHRFEYLGVDNATGLYLFQSANGPIPIPSSPNDYRLIGDLDPDFYGGIKTGMRYKTIRFDLFIDFRKQLGANYRMQVNYSAPGSGLVNQPTRLMERWQGPGETAPVQRYTAFASGNLAAKAANSFTQSSGGYSDASFIRVNTCALSYALPGKALQRIGIRQCTFHVTAQNLFTITHYAGTDPEIQSFYDVPNLRMIVAGIQVGF